jgi:divalent metal cation (Fe/Co/Zn/Cd) transporter
MLPNASFRSCPSCGAALNNGAVTCNSCGGLVVVESILGRLRAEVRHHSGLINERLKNRTILLWTLALCPIVILPPVLALFLNFRPHKGTEGQAAADAHSPDVLISIVAVCNIILSVLFWRWIGDSAISLGLSIGLLLKSIGINHPSGLRSI